MTKMMYFEEEVAGVGGMCRQWVVEDGDASRRGVRRDRQLLGQHHRPDCLNAGGTVWLQEQLDRRSECSGGQEDGPGGCRVAHNVRRGRSGELKLGPLDRFRALLQ